MAVLHGSLGVSCGEYPAAVASILASTLPWTLVLVGVATVISFALGTLLGILAARRRGGLLDSLLPGMTFFQAVPYFFLALLLIDLFGVHLGWLPRSGGSALGVTQGRSWPFVQSAIDLAVLPALTFVLASLAGWMVARRNVMTTTIGEEHVLAGQANGLPGRRVVMTYAAGNAILASIASFANALGFVISGVLIVEHVFSYPGIGYLRYNAVGNEEYPLRQGSVLVIALAVLAANLPADVAYLVLDPRTRRRAAYRWSRSSRSRPPTLASAPARRRLPGAGLSLKARVGGGIVALFVLAAIVGPFFAPYDPSATSAAILQGPSAAHLLGTTSSGQDVLASCWWAPVPSSSLASSPVRWPWRCRR